LRERTGLSARRLTGLLNLLEGVGAVRLGTRRVTLAEGAPDTSSAAESARELAERHRDIERTRLEMMRRYAETANGRRRLLLGCFGEDLADPCGNCDTCRAGTAHDRTEGGGPFQVHARVEHATWGSGDRAGHPHRPQTARARSFWPGGGDEPLS
jgi:ATP-dependent DNA helicase RecQ